MNRILALQKLMSTSSQTGSEEILLMSTVSGLCGTTLNTLTPCPHP
ncbi:MAG TPA: hypothetical protein VHA33_26520 [Candidatus Angelobacter sp.]|nr:hypothetical protein [Candidatus Angelobacter sp.]